ncbi:MAG: hypothetical protein WD016_10840 [Balneolaceae bacterium]
MNKETARLLFMDYLYDELEADQKTELEKYLSEHPDLQNELNELADVRSLLTHLPVQDPAGQLVIVEPEQKNINWWGELREALIPKNNYARAGFAMAACLLVFMVTAAFLQINMSMNDDGFTVAFGERESQPEQAFSVEQVEYLINQVKEENALLMAQFIEVAQEQQDQKLEEAFTSFAHFVDQQRTSDLRLISSDLSSLEETYYDRFRKTDQVLGEIIQTVSTRN